MISPQFFSDWPTHKISECLNEAQKELERRGVPSTTVIEFDKFTCEQLALFKLASADELERRNPSTFDVRRN